MNRHMDIDSQPRGRRAGLQRPPFSLSRAAMNTRRRHNQGAASVLAADQESHRQRLHRRTVLEQQARQPQFQIGPIGVRVQQGPKLPPL